MQKPLRIRQSAGSRAFDAFNVALMILLMAVTLYPLWYVAVVSVSDGKAVLAGKVNLWPVGLTLASFKVVLKDSSVLLSFRNSVLYTVVGTLINLTMTTICAYPLTHADLAGRKVLMRLIVFTMFFSGGMIPSYLVVRQLGLIDTIGAMVLPGAISTYNMVVMRSFFSSIPDSLQESAYLDGANDLQVFLRIVLPLSMPIVATMLLFYAVGHWNAYMNALLYLNKKALLPIQSILRNMVVESYMTNTAMDMGAGSDFAVIDTTVKYAVIMVATLPILCVYPFVQKHFVKGVMIGSLKG